MKLKAKLYGVAALILMFLGHIVGRFMTIFAVLLVILLALFLLWPAVKRTIFKSNKNTSST